MNRWTIVSVLATLTFGATTTRAVVQIGTIQSSGGELEASVTPTLEPPGDERR